MQLICPIRQQASDEMEMIMQYFLFILFFTLPAYAMAEEASKANFCSTAMPEDKFVFKPDKDHGEQVCTFDGFKEIGEKCEYDHGGRPALNEIVDLNSDGHSDFMCHISQGECGVAI